MEPSGNDLIKSEDQSKIKCSKKSKESEASNSDKGSKVPYNQKGYKRVLVIVTVILASTMYEINTSSFTVIINAIAQEMIPLGMAPSQVGWLISLPAIFMIPGVLLGYFLVRRVKVKMILMVTWGLFGLSGMAIYICQTPMQIFAMRAIMGLCIGLSEPMAKVLPARLFDGPFRSKVMGWLGLGGGGLSVLTSFIVGQLGLLNWRLAMFIYPCYALIFIVFLAIGGPDLPVEKGPSPFNFKVKQRPFGHTVWVMCIAGFILYVVCSVIQIETSIQVAEVGLGGTNVASYVSMSSTAGIIVGALLFGKLYETLKRWLFPIALVFAAVFYFCFANATTVIGLCLSGGLANIFTIPILCVYTITRASYAAPQERVTTAVTTVSLFWYVGQVLTTPYINFVQSIWGATAKVALTSVGVVFVAFAVVSVIYILATKHDSRNFITSRGDEE